MNGEPVSGVFLLSPLGHSRVPASVIMQVCTLITLEGVCVGMCMYVLPDGWI